MHSTSISASVPVGLALALFLSPKIAACTAPTQDPTVGPSAPSQPAVVDSQSSIFGAPLYVNGKRISDDRIKLYLIYGPCKAIFDMARIGVIVEDELRRRSADSAEQTIHAREAEKPFESPEARKKAWDAEYQNQLAQIHEKFRVTEEEVQKEVDRMVGDFKKNYPVLDLDSEIRRGFRDIRWYREQMRQTVLFDHVFLPVNPDEWPVVTTEAVRADSGEVLVEDAYVSYKSRKKQAQEAAARESAEESVRTIEAVTPYTSPEARKAAVDAEYQGLLPQLDEKFPVGGLDLIKEDPIYMGIMRDIVRSAVFKLCDFKTPSEGLPETQCLWVDTNGDGIPELVVSTDEMWEKVKDTVSETEIQEAKRWFVTYSAARDRLEKDGFLPSGDACDAAIEALGRQFESANFGVEALATTTYYFPSVATYKDYFCLLEGFRKMQEPKLQPGPGGELAPVLRERFEKSNRVMGLGQIDVEIMLVSAFDIPHFRWKPDGWKWAEAKAKDLMAQVEENARAYGEQRTKVMEARARGEEYKPEKEVPEPYRFWTQLMDDHSEWWDPPPPAEKGRQSMVGYKMRGRFGAHYRNDLTGFMEENYFTQWVTGQSVTDHVFFDQPEGSVAGPFKAARGYYVTRVMRRMPPTRSLNMSEPKHVELLREDWLRVMFIDYAKEAVAQAKVKGV